MSRASYQPIRSGTSFVRGVTIDLLLDDPADVATLYERWDPAWGEPLGFQGGEIAITCDMVAAVPLPQLVKKYGKSRTERYLAAAQKYQEG